MKDSSKKKTQLWLVIGVIVLIALLLLWLTFADLSGDTDVSAQVKTFATSAFYA